MNLKGIKIGFSLIIIGCSVFIGEATGQQSKLPPLKLQEMEMPCKQLFEAIKSGKLDRVQKALDQGNNVNCLLVDVYPLPLAAQRRDLPMMKLLLSRGAKIDLGYENENALMIAVGMNDLAITKYLLEKKANPNSNEGSDLTGTHLMLAVQKGNLEIAKLLVKYGANINCQLSDGSTAMKMAQKNGHTAIVKFLKDAGAKR